MIDSLMQVELVNPRLSEMSPSHGMAIVLSIVIRLTNPRYWRAPPLNDESFCRVVCHIRSTCGDAAGVLVVAAMIWYVFEWGGHGWPPSFIHNTFIWPRSGAGMYNLVHTY